MTVEQQLELMRGMLNDLIVKVDTFAETATRRDEEYNKLRERADDQYRKLRERMLRGALGLLGTDDSEGIEPKLNGDPPQ